MSTRKKPSNLIQRLLRRTWRSFNVLTKTLLNWVLRGLMVHKRSRLRQSQSGFVLPTVVMVLLVVVLLTTAIVIRSFDRAKNASNYRVDQAVLNAATPALDRSRAKIERLFSPEENRLTSNPPAEGLNYDDAGTISRVLSEDQYTFGDETPLKVVFDINENQQIEKNEQIKTAWKFPTDTDNNGKFDSFTLYGIYFRNPLPGENRARKPLEARAIPQATGQIDTCAAATNSGGSASERQGWYETDGQLKKAFFTYVANVPITQIGTLDQTKYEIYTGNKSFSALEMQQDQGQIALDNNAVWYDDDLVISNVPPLNLNGRIHTNSNLMMANNGGDQITLWQVSSLESCYYTAENAKIIVGGHVAAGDITGDTNGNATDSGENLVKIHLYQGAKPLVANPPRPDQSNVKNVDEDNKTTTFNPAAIATNSNAYESRRNLLVSAALKLATSPINLATVSTNNRYPKEVKDNFKAKFDPTDPSSGESILKQVLTTYFGERIRRVSYQEVGVSDDPLKKTPSDAVALNETTVFSGSGEIAAPLEWMVYNNNTTNSAILPVKASTGGGIDLKATDPDDLDPGRAQVEYNIGDRIVVGNSLPRRPYKGNNASGNPDYAEATDKQDIPGGVPWNNKTGGLKNGTTRYRKGLTEQLDDLGDTSRGGYWERAAALSGKEFEEQLAIKELAGGLRVITGAGIYIDGIDPGAGGTGVRGKQSFLPPPPTAVELKELADNDQGGIKLPKDIQTATLSVLQNDVRVVWPDTMPMFEWKDNNLQNNLYDLANGEVKKGDLQMRSTVVYHYAQDAGTDQTPIACIATYYDPTSAKTAQNMDGLLQDPEHIVPVLADDANAPKKGASINGLNYDASGLVGLRSSAHTNLKLVRQANMIFPDGRWVNKPLRDAVLKLATQGMSSLDLGDISAIDAANCALGILANPTGVTANSLMPNFAIKEEAFLDARQIKALHKRDTIANFPTTTKPPYEPATSSALARLNDANGLDVTRETKREYISNTDKLKIAELGELNIAGLKGNPLVPNYPYYSLPIEQRQPLEIRVTQIDLDKLRTTLVKSDSGTGINNKDEYLLPNSGIIYASRDDALSDISNINANNDGDNGSSATDFLLDPTRRPNGILLVKGANLARGVNKNDYRIAEKGLILASDLPVYIKSQNVAANEGGFNLHLKPGSTDINDTTVREEFKALLLPDYSNFYTRLANADGSGFNKSFACRPDAANPTACPDSGDQWRAARILSDAVTLLSSNFRFGYRNEGDFDINNNAGNLAVESRLKNGFWWNSYATNGEWLDTATGFPKDFEAATETQGSTYATNGVTPIQRRVPPNQGGFTEYRMEICRKLPVAACGPGDWKLTEKIDTNSNGVPDTDVPIGGTTAPSPPAPLAVGASAIDKIRYVAPDDRRYPRRVAFVRNSLGEINLPNCTAGTPADCKPVPIAVNNTGTEVIVPYDGMTGSVAPPTQVDNALWFWTTVRNTNPSAAKDETTPLAAFTSLPDVSYNNTNKLYYAPYEPEEVSERQLILPGLPEFPKVLKDAGMKTLNSATSTGSTNLRSAPSDYAVFNFDNAICKFSPAYKPETANLADCATDTETNTNTTAIQDAIKYAWGTLLTYNPTVNDDVVYLDKNDTANPLPFNPTGGLPVGDSTNKIPITLKAYAKVNIYSLPKPDVAANREVLSGLEITFDANNRIDDPIFVIRPFDYTQNLANKTALAFVNYVKVIPKGVDPNNIFWVPTNFLQIRVHNDANDHELAGNFIGGGLGADSLLAFTNNAGTTVAPPTTKQILKGGRFLGFSPSSAIPANVMTAMTTAAEPLVMPVLNLHSPQGAPDATPEAAFGGDSINENYWVQRVPSTVTENYNAVFIMGDSPSRPFTGKTGKDSGESGGGLANFPRFLEAWQDVADNDGAAPKADTKIRGSFIQFKKSIFATAPFEAIDDPQSDNSLFFDSPTPGDKPDYMADFDDADGPPLRPYIYKGGAQSRKAPYYRPPDRLWGYDVGLLKQSPDLFSRRFSTPSAGTPNEYFREVSRSDLWIQALMCAAQQTPPAAAGAKPTYSNWAIGDPKQRPTPSNDFPGCQEPTPAPNKYNDP